MKARSIIDSVFGVPSGLYGEHDVNYEKIVSAAVKIDDDIFLGDDHAAAINNAVDHGGYPYMKSSYDSIHGFYTNKGRFLSREDAMDLSLKTRQLKRVKSFGRYGRPASELDSADLVGHL